MSESQAFFLLSVLCDRLLPGYYSTTMYGTLLDQRVFEALVEKTMPVLWEHLVKSDVQLSVVSLPWFLSLYINSMPLVFAFRVLDVFFLEGPKVLFQVGLAILRINGEDLLDVTDDGTFISILKTFFSRLDESAHPTSENPKLRAVTKFQELMVVAFKEFAGITQATISEQRSKHKDVVLDSIESFAKRTSIRNLGPESKRLTPEDLGFLYDRFYGLLYEQQQRMQVQREENDKRVKAGRNKAAEIVIGIPATNTVEMGRVGLGPSPTLMNYDAFREFLAGVTRWAVADVPRTPMRETSMDRDSRAQQTLSPKGREFLLSPWGDGFPEPADHDFMQRLYGQWNKDDNDGLSLQSVVSGLAHIKGTRDIMTSISYFFDLYDDDQDGKVDREGILRISEALLFLTRRGMLGGMSPSPSLSSFSDSMHEGNQYHLGLTDSNISERFLNSVSAFIKRCFEYADPDHPQNQDNIKNSNCLSADMEKFSIGNDQENEDLVDLSDTTKPPDPTVPNALFPPSNRSTSLQPESKRAANLALNPAHPLHITLPTFRMVILADELLQQFFEFSFAESFRLSPVSINPTTPLTPFPMTPHSASLTTFSNFHQRAQQGAPVPPTPGASAKGLRGVLDNIVSDGMRVAAEVRKRMDEAQKDMEKNATGRDEDEDEDEDEEGRAQKGDRELLEGAEVGSVKEVDEGVVVLKNEEMVDLITMHAKGADGETVEFER